VGGDVEGAGCEGEGLRVVSCNMLTFTGMNWWGDVPLLCVTTPRLRTSSSPISSMRRNTAWNAPRTLNAPMRCRFSHLKNSLILGFAGSCPSHCVLLSASAVCGVDARVERVVFVRMGVRWMWGLMIAWAATTDSRVKGREDVLVAMALVA
jgi:hypothetical protein